MPTPNRPAEPIEPQWTEVLRTYGEGFAGRQAELAALHRAWNEGMRVFVLHAEGGAGKTRVVAKWLTELRDAGWRGAGRVFVHSFYSQGSDEHRNASSELFFENALRHFGHPGPPLTDPTEKGRTLARLLIEQSGLLVLDGLEPLQHPPAFDQGRLKDPAVYSLFVTLAAGRIGNPPGTSAGGLCIVTSRQPIVELRDKTGRMVVQQPLDRLDAEAGVNLLRQLEVRGPERELREAVEDAHGHAYSLTLLGSYLRDATDDHEIRRRREIPLLDEDKEHRYHARHLFGAYVEHLGEDSPEVAVLRLLGFFDRPAERKLLSVLREGTEAELSRLTAPLRKRSSTDWHRILRRLTTLRLIDILSSTSPIDSHSLLREYFAEQVRMHFPEACQSGHRRLFEHLCETTEYLPGTLTGLQPLYQAVAHGCQAGLHEQALFDVYIDRILRGTGNNGFYSAKKLGAMGADLGAVACFFTTPWTILAPNLTPTAQAWLLGEASSRLQALGRLTEAVEPTLASTEISVEQNDWINAARISNNLSEIELTRGDIPAAITAGEQSVIYADRSGDAPEQISKRTTLADALHHAGRRAEARRWMEDAESRQAAWQPDHPRLYSVWGFRHCDLLLAETERVAWQRRLGGESGPGETTACDAVIEKASQTLAWANRRLGLLDVALDHLTLARAQLYKGELVSDHFDAAVDGLRAAGFSNYLAGGLLTRAWLRCLSGDEEGSRSDLDEAWEIAERGPMPLFQADIQLYRARLFRDQAALAEARRLIEKHGYHRRDEELADAEEAAANWPDVIRVAPDPGSEPKGDLPEVENTSQAESTMNTPSTQESQVDFVILTPLGEERDAVLARLPGHRQLPPTHDDIRVHYAAEVPVSFSDGSSTSYSIIVTPLAKMGHTEASAVTSDVIRRWKPRYVLLVGIAGGTEKTGVKLGDVLISDQVADYELAKVTADKTTIRWQVHRVDQRLLIAAQNFLGNQWQRTESRRYDKRAPEVHFGPICTGNKVVADESLATQFQEVWAKLIGVEMEAGGVANAVSQSAHHSGFFMIRGVSDLADGKKGSRSVERWRPYAREIAAAWTIEFLKSGPVPATAVAPLDLDALRETLQPAATPEPTLSTDQLLKQLKRLPAAQFEELVFRYDSDNSIPGKTEAQSVRAIELLKLMQSREGGLTTLLVVLQRLRHGDH